MIFYQKQKSSFSLCTQKADTNITDITDAAQSTQRHYNRLKKKLDKDPEFVFKLSTLASVLSEIKENDREKTYQDQKLNNFTQAKDYIQNHASDTVSKMIICFDNYFANIYEQNKLHSDEPSEEGDKIIFDVCMALNCCVWPSITPDGDLKPLSNQFKSFKNLFSCYCNMMCSKTSRGKPFRMGL